MRFTWLIISLQHCVVTVWRTHHLMILNLKSGWGCILGTGGMRGEGMCLAVPPFLSSPLFSFPLLLTCHHVIASSPADKLALSIATSQEPGEHVQHSSRGSSVRVRGGWGPALGEHTGGGQSGRWTTPPMPVLHERKWICLGFVRRTRCLVLALRTDETKAFSCRSRSDQECDKHFSWALQYAQGAILLLFKHFQLQD